MLIRLAEDMSEKDLEELRIFLDPLDLSYNLWRDGNNFFCGLDKPLEPGMLAELKQFPFIDRVFEEYSPDSLKNAAPEIKVKNRTISRGNFTVIAGPCTIDDKKGLRQTAGYLKAAGISLLRGGAYKLRSSPHSYQGLGKEALRYMKDICNEYDLVSVSEIISIEDLDLMLEYIDILIIGTRNMQNYRLLSALGTTSKPVILKRGMASTIKEWLLAAEYIAKEGNRNIILCERGIRTFENYTRNTLDLSAVPAVKKLSPYPVIVDPSHGSGRKEMVKPLSWAAAAVGADGLLIECHSSPESAKCDARQTIDIDELQEIIRQLPDITKLWEKK